MPGQDQLYWSLAHLQYPVSSDLCSSLWNPEHRNDKLLLVNNFKFKDVSPKMSSALCVYLDGICDRAGIVIYSEHRVALLQLRGREIGVALVLALKLLKQWEIICSRKTACNKDHMINCWGRVTHYQSHVMWLESRSHLHSSSRSERRPVGRLAMRSRQSVLSTKLTDCQWIPSATYSS